MDCDQQLTSNWIVINNLFQNASCLQSSARHGGSHGTHLRLGRYHTHVYMYGVCHVLLVSLPVVLVCLVAHVVDVVSSHHQSPRCGV